MTYRNAKIYKIVDNTNDAIYVGSTCKTLEQRLKQHEYDYVKFKAGKQHFITSFKILENNNYKIELVKLFPCDSKIELELQEGKIIKEYRNNKLNIVNICVAGQTHKESVFQHYQKNKIAINERRNHKHVCFCGGKFTTCGKSQHEKSKKHQNYINNSKTLINNGTLNIHITVNNVEDVDKILDKLTNTIK